MAQPMSTSTGTAPSPARFQTVRLLGKGGQGFVQLALDTLTGKQCAVKYIDRGFSRSFYKYVLRELTNHYQLSLCKHPHIVEFYEVFLTPRYLGIVLEYVQGCNLQQYLEQHGGKLPEDIARFIFQQLIIAVDFCHRLGKVNRDIKLANILLQEGPLPLVKLCDFGFSKDKFDDSEPQTQIGTALFTAPEVFTNVQGQSYDAESADIWSCGVVLYVMLYGGHPFLSSEDYLMQKQCQVLQLIENSVSGNLQLPPESADTLLAADLISKILVPDPARRYKLHDIVQHPWFADKLPPGALVLNEAYLSMEVDTSQSRQTPEAIKQVLRAAISVSSNDVLERALSTTSGVTTEMSEGSFLQDQHGPLPNRQSMQSLSSAVSKQKHSEHDGQQPFHPQYMIPSQPTPFHSAPKHVPSLHSGNMLPVSQFNAMPRPGMAASGQHPPGLGIDRIMGLAADSAVLEQELQRLMNEDPTGALKGMGMPGYEFNDPAAVDPPGVDKPPHGDLQDSLMAALGMDSDNVLLDSSMLYKMGFESNQMNFM